MAGPVQLAPQPLFCRKAKFAARPLSTCLFSGAASRQLQAGEALFVAGEAGDGYQLEQGLLKVDRNLGRGAKSGSWPCSAPARSSASSPCIDGGPRSASVFAVRDCELSFISRAAFEERTIRHPEIYQYLINVLATRLRETDEAMAAASFLTVQARLARALLELGKHVGRRRRRGAPRAPSQDQPGRPCGNGRGGAREREQGHSRLEAEQGDYAMLGFYYLIDIATLLGAHPLKVCIEGPRVREFFTHRESSCRPSNAVTLTGRQRSAARMSGPNQPPQLFRPGHPRHVKVGERLFAIGDAGDGCYRLDHGLLKVVVASPLGEERIIAILSPGAIVGEFSVIDGLPRSASVVALQDCMLRFVSRENFQQRANTHPETSQALLQSWPQGYGKWMRPWRPQPSSP